MGLVLSHRKSRSRLKLTQVSRGPNRSVRLQRRERFKRGRIRGYGGKAFVPDPLGRLLDAVQAAQLGGAELHHILLSRVVDDLCRSCANEQNIPGTKFDALVRSAGFHVLHSDAVSPKRVEVKPLGLGIGSEVEQHASGGEASAGVPVVQRGELVGGRRLDGEAFACGPGAVVSEAGGLVDEVAEAVPLAAGLGVESQLVVPRDGAAEVFTGHGVGQKERRVLGDLAA